MSCLQCITPDDIILIVVRTGGAVQGLCFTPHLPSGLVSSGRDCRVKCWDLTTQACAATIKLSSPSSQLLNIALGDHCMVCRGVRVIELLDLRCATPVMRVQSPSGAFSCMCVHKGLVAAGHRNKASVWDLRCAVPAGSSSSPSSMHGPTGHRAPAALLSVKQSRGMPISSIYLDRLKLVTATSAVQLHAGDSINVWSMPDGRALRQLSCT